jgi:copper transport protein
MTRTFRTGLALGVALILALPVLSWAHAHLVRSSPSADARLDVAPTLIQLWFSEKPELALSSVSLVDSAGAVVRLGPLRAGDTSLAIAAPILDRLAAGQYTVRWRVVSSDGHPSNGSFSFISSASAVAEDTMPARPETAVAPDTSGNPAESLAYIVARALEFAALLVTIGAPGFRYFVMRRAVENDEVLDGMTRRLASVGAIAAAIALASALVRLGLEWQMLNGDPATVRVHLSTMTMETQWGGAWLVQAVTLVFALGAFGLARGGSRAGWVIAALAALVLAVSPALAGHAGADADHRVIAVAADGLHVLGASVWLGSVFCIVAVGIPVLVKQADDAWRSIATLVNAFSPVALGAAAVVLLTGLTSAWLRLGAIAPLWTTSYGRTLLIKLGVVVGIAIMGAYNWRRMRPALGTAAATARFRKSAAAELGFGAAVIVVTAVLVAMPLG